MVSTKQHPLAPPRTVNMASGVPRRSLQVPIPLRARNDIGDEPELLCSVRDSVEVQPPEVVARVVRETVSDDGVVGDARREARGQRREGAAGVREQHAQRRVAVEHPREDEPRRRCRRLHRESQREREDVPVVVLTEGLLGACAEPVVRVEEDDEACGGEGGPDGFEGFVVEPVAESARAEDDAAQVGEGADVGD